MEGTSRYCIREAGRRSPSLVFAQSFWALQQREQPVPDLLEAACAAGYTYLEAGLSEERMPLLRQLLHQFPLRLIAQGWATSAEQAWPFLERAVELGACCINFHLGHAFLSNAEAVHLIEEVSRQAEALKLPLLLETHRGRLTQDLARATEVLALTPAIPVVLDVSHYLVAGEGSGGDLPSFLRHMGLLTDRTAILHGRISDGQSIQVQSIQASGEDSFALQEMTRTLWQEAMSSWLAEAPPDAVLVFEPELGPPPYAQRDSKARELFSRSDETETLRQWALEAWRAATGTTAAGTTAEVSAWAR